MPAGRSTFAPNVIDEQQIFDGAVSHEKISDDSVETHNIKNLNVTSEKLAAGILTNGTRCRVAYAEVNLAATAVVPLGTIPGGSLITNCIASCRVAADGNGTVIIGDVGDDDGILANANISKLLNAISGEDPATYGVYLWVPGVQDNVTIGAGTQTTDAGPPADFTVTVWPAITQQPAVTTYGHPRVKWVPSDTVYNATVVKGTNTVGTLDVYLFYTRGVMSG